MRKLKQIVCLVSAAALLSVLFSECGNPADEKPSDTFNYTSFRDIPGVTEDEIKAIEALQKQTDSFVYGMNQSTETLLLENGEIGGFSALFCQWLTGLFEIPFKPAIYEWDDLLVGLETQDIDFTGELTATDERRKTYFMTSTIIQRMLKTFRIQGREPLSEISATRPLRCAFLRDSTTIDDVTKLLYGKYEILEVYDYNSAYELLKSGKADAFFDESPAEASLGVYDDIVTTNFFPLVFSPVSLTTQNPALKPVISVVQKALDNGAPLYFAELYNTGYHEYLKYKLFSQFSEEEITYIKDHPVVPFAAGNGNYPVSFYNAYEKKWQGISFDMLREVEDLTGIRFELAHDQHTLWRTAVPMLESGEVSMISGIIRSNAREDAYLWADTPIMTDYYALISKSDFRDISLNEILHVKIATINRTSYAEEFNRWFPDHKNVITYQDTDTAIDALERGDVDMLMANEGHLLMIANLRELTGYKANIIFDYTFDSDFGFNKNDVILRSIVDKALRLINTGKITDQWRNKTYDYRIKVVQSRTPWVISSFVSLLLAFALVAVLFVRNSRAGRLLGQWTRELEVNNITLTTLFDSMPDLVFTLNTSLLFTHCNKIFLDHFGLNKEDIIDKNEYSLGVPAEKAKMFNHWNRRVIEEGETFAIEERIPRFDGTAPLYETVKKPLVLDGSVIGVLGIAHDITKRKEIEEAALAASQSKSVFLANMSHEIRTPMNSIIGFSELAMDDKISPKTKDYLEKIKTNGEWLLQIINDILDISKIESGKMELENIPFDMHELFSSCRTLILPRAIENGTLLHFYAEPSIGKKPLGDPTRLRQVLLNLLSNAVKFTNNGMVKLHAAIIEKSEKTISMHFEVIDSGIGMTPEQVKKIFDPFTQAETGTTRKYGGTGLGLSITKNIVEMMGGTLLVESAVGVGSKFSFKLTFDTIDISDEDMLEKKIVLNELEKPVFEGEILLCEDNVMNQQVICEHLARVGFKTVVADNGKIGVELVKNRIKKGEKQFDLIFMDMHMPVMDGLEASDEIIKLKANIPIVAMTANVMSEDRKIYKMKGINDCVGKPFTSQELWHCLMKYFKPVKWQAVNKTQNTQAENELRRRLINNFIKDNKNKLSEITEALNSGDIKLAYRLAHTLKSNAGHLGATALQQAAANVEDCLKDGQNTVTARHLAALETEMNAALAELSAEAAAAANSAPQANEVSATEAAVQTDPVDAEYVNKLFEKLEPMLQMGNLECRELVDSLRRIPGSEQLRQNIENLDFEDAIVSFAELRKNYEIKN